jgi:hypothetical protein
MSAPDWLPLTPIVPAGFAVAALLYERHTARVRRWLVESVAAACALICVAVRLLSSNAPTALSFLIAAFVLSIVGDLFMARRTHQLNFIAGIGFFLLAHLGFLSYALTRSPFHWVVFVVLLAICAVIFVLWLRPSPGLSGHPPLAIASLAYICVSCLSLAAATDLGSRAVASWIYTVGILSLTVSDMFIAFNDFVGAHRVKPWIMPLYYLCHVLVVVSVVLAY